MPKGEVEARLGEVAGELRALRPTLEALDRRLETTRDLAVRAVERSSQQNLEIQGFRKDVAQHKAAVSRRVAATEAAMDGLLETISEARENIARLEAEEEDGAPIAAWRSA
jgi:chromosome segregation ATPase